MATESPYSAQNVMKFVNNNFGLLLLGASLFLGGFVIGTIWKENQLLAKGGLPTTGQVANDQAAPVEATPLSEADWAEVQDGSYLTIGDSNAPVTIVEFTDYQCPFCSRHHVQTHPQLMENYVNTGKVKILVRDQALPFHPNANSAAQAVRCAVEQNKGEAMYNALFDNQDAWANLTGDAVVAKYRELASAAGLNGNNLGSCVESGKHKAAVDEDSALGNRVGAAGTPTFFIEGEPLVGAYPYEDFERIIEEKLGN